MARVLVVALSAVALSCGPVHRKEDSGVASGGQLLAEIRDAVPSRESAMYATVTVLFHNPTERSVRVRHYRITWPGGTFESDPKNLDIAASGTREWSVRVTPVSGDLDHLLSNPSGAVVEVN
jgi:hypothetical protein